MSMHPYNNEFADDNVYGHAAALLATFQSPPGLIHLDFGCGFGNIAETVRDRLGLRYIGLDVLEDGLNSIKARGFEAMFFDLRDPAAGIALLDSWLPPGVGIASITCLDTLEHLAEPEKAVKLLHALASRHASPLIMSVPNVGHSDISIKLLGGRFDYTESGLLDHTHYQYYTEERLRRFMSGAGWHEVARKDVELEESDQHFPQHHPLLSRGTPGNAFIALLRKQADSSSAINQFVRAYLPSTPARHEDDTSDAPFLTVVIRTQGARIESLRESILCLSAQTCQDFEVLVVGHRLDRDRQLAVEGVISDQMTAMRSKTRLIKVDHGERATPLNAAFEHAKGRYVAMFDDDDLVFGHWVETFKKLSDEHPGKLLRTTTVSQTWEKPSFRDRGLVTRSRSGYRAEYPEAFDLFDHLIENRSPLHSLAFPRAVHSDLGFRFDETLTTAEDWDYIMSVCHITGVASSAEITCVYRRWENASSSYTAHDQEEWKANYQYSLRKMDARPLLLPPGYTRKVRKMLLDRDQSRGEAAYHSVAVEAADRSGENAYLEALRWRLHELVNSRSWRYTAWIRAVVDRFTGRRSFPEMRIWRFSIHDLEYLIGLIEGSRSWRLMAVFRALGTSLRAVR
jgi:2-polyprenyl-3-methyl-5-hydroxy-6-metoxy-1,4-benzoquinol methylase/glycosyltransferase involved in cell wall biosynthesis